WSALRPHQRDGATRLTASHLAGLGSIVCDRVGAGKRLTILSHVLHLRDVVGVRGPHLVVCEEKATAAWISELNRFCPKLRAVTLRDAAEERNPAKAAILRSGNVDLVVVPRGMMI
ncbi:uncharacterized protein MICPUCDRAFT_7977, partial [Micromonas pusilla CCMP1545]